MKSPTRFPRLSFAVSGALLLALALPLAAQQGSGFLFQRPRISLGFSAGYAVPRADSELFDFTREYLTVERGDLNAVTLQGELAVRVNERLDVALTTAWSGSRTTSEFRDWIGTDNLPILQTTRFVRVPLTIGAKGFLFDRGRSIGRFAWVPARWSPYAGAALGAVWYSFEQDGEFVDYETLDIYRDYYSSKGWAPTVHVLAGAEVSLAMRLVMNLQGRYAWASTPLSRHFQDFDDIDLAGFQATAGLSLRF